MGKHIQQRKRKSLSDLFKILSSIGMMGNNVFLLTSTAFRLAEFGPVSHNFGLFIPL